MSAQHRFALALGVLTICASAVLMEACASNDASEENGPTEGTSDASPALDAAASDAVPDAPCADCEYFPTTCTPDVFCPAGGDGPSNPATSFHSRTDFLFVRGRSANDVWVVGAIGAAAHFDGTSWTKSDVGAPDTLRTLWLHDDGELAFGRFSNVYTRGFAGDTGAPDASVSEGGWRFRGQPAEVPSLFDFYQFLRSSWSVAGSDTLWVATRGDPGNANNSGLWRLRRTAPSGFQLIAGISSQTCNDIGCTEVNAIHSASPSTLWAVGGAGAAVRIASADGETPTARAFNSQTSYSLFSVWAASDDDVWAVGASGTIRHYQGDPRLWDVVDGVPTSESLNGVWGLSSTDIWAVGDAGVVLHYDGNGWSRVQVGGLGGSRPDLHAVWAAGPGSVWIAGRGVILSLGGKL